MNAISNSIYVVNLLAQAILQMWEKTPMYMVSFIWTKFICEKDAKKKQKNIYNTNQLKLLYAS